MELLIRNPDDAGFINVNRQTGDIMIGRDSNTL